jgi:hypothetical protein
MKTRLLILGLGWAPVLLQCGGTTERLPAHGQSGNGAGGGVTDHAGSKPTDGGSTPTAIVGGTASVEPNGGVLNGGTNALAGAGGFPAVGGAGGVGGTMPLNGPDGGAPPGETPVACPANVLGHCSQGVVYPPHPGFTLALVEDFPEPLDLNTDPIWTWSDGSLEDTQTEYEEDNISFARGRMLITADQKSGVNCMPKTTNALCIDGRTSFAEALDPNTTASIGKMGVASGELRTKYNNYRYGYYEVKLTAPIANPGQESVDDMSGGFVSAMYAFRTPSNVEWRELNVMLSPDHRDGFAGQVASATGAVSFPGGNVRPFLAKPANFLLYREHVYAFSWMPDKIEWFCDGASVHSFAGSAAVPISTLSAKIMLNLWVFSGNAFGDPANNKFPFDASFDYFHFYKADAETTYPCSPTPTCLPAADKTKSAQNNPKEVNYGQ